MTFNCCNVDTRKSKRVPQVPGLSPRQSHEAICTEVTIGSRCDHICTYT